LDMVNVNQKWLFTFKDLEGAEVKELVELKDIQQQTKELQLDKVEIEKDDCVLSRIDTKAVLTER